MKKKKENKNLLIKLGDFITNYRYIFLTIFLGLFIFCFININNVKINDSIVSYLPDNTETKRGINIMEEEFGSLNTIKLMINNISLEEAEELVTKLNKVDKVETVLFDNTKSYKEDSALYTIELDKVEDEEIDTVKDNIEKVVIDKDYDIYSESFEDATDGIDIALLLAVVVIIVILLITSKTYFEPVMAFIIFVISIVLNMGTNFLLQEISYITKAIAVILQLALSIDYVIIFMNQFMKEINDTDNKVLAIKKTVSKAMPEIFASSLTTISGLLALTFMQLKIGGDIGIVLSKGIICSLLTVILVMPSLLAIFTNIIIKLKKQEKTKITKLTTLSEFILKSRKVLLPIFVVLVIISVFLISNYKYVYNATSASSIRLSENVKALDNIEEKFGTNNTLVILVKDENKDYEKELELANKLKENDKITSVISLGSYEIDENISLATKLNYIELSQMFNIDENLSLNLYKYYANLNNELDKLVNINDYKISIINLIYFLNDNSSNLNLDEALLTQINSYYSILEESKTLLESSNYSRFILNLDTLVEGEDTYKLVDEIRSISSNYYEDVTLVGNTINAMDLEESFTSDNLIITGITILFIAIILLFTFKSFWLSLLLILTIEGSILINFAIVSLLGKEIFFMSYIVVSAIQMGATIDYAIVIASRYQQLRGKCDKKEAIIRTLEDRLPAVITSGLILLIAGFLIGFISASSVISSIGLFLGIGTLISLLGAILILPTILYLLDKIIVKN